MGEFILCHQITLSPSLLSSFSILMFFILLQYSSLHPFLRLFWNFCFLETKMIKNKCPTNLTVGRIHHFPCENLISGLGIPAGSSSCKSNTIFLFLISISSLQLGVKLVFFSHLLWRVNVQLIALGEFWAAFLILNTVIYYESAS